MPPRLAAVLMNGNGLSCSAWASSWAWPAVACADTPEHPLASLRLLTYWQGDQDAAQPCCFPEAQVRPDGMPWTCLACLASASATWLL